MKIRFLGADRTVTGTCHLLEINGRRIALDCGLFQGRREESRRINSVLHPELLKADAIILSHGHLDHCGKLPALVAAGWRGPIYCTPATAAVAKIVLEDAAEIQVEDADYLNRRARGPDEPPARPLYTPIDAREVLKLLRSVDYGRRTDLGDGAAFTFQDAGHILGSAWVLVESTEAGATRTLLFTADIGRPNTPILADPTPPTQPVDVIITESTYGGMVHPPMSGVREQLLDAFKSAIARRGRIVVPAFAVGRTQTILWYYEQFVHEGAIPPMPVFVDSPMGVEVTHAYAGFPNLYDAETQDRLKLVGGNRPPITLAVTGQQSREINAVRGPCLIVASSPTLEFGRVLHHVKQSIERPEDTIVFVGWTPPETLGRRIIEGEQRVKILDRFYDVRCQRRVINGLSAHAGGDELMAFLKPALAKNTIAFVVHGEPARAEAHAAAIAATGATAIVPATETAYVFGTPPPVVKTSDVRTDNARPDE